VLSLALALHRAHPPAGSAALGWLAWCAAVVAAGGLAGLLFLTLARGGPNPADPDSPLLGVLLLGAGIGYAADLSPFLVCAVAAALIVNRTPHPHLVRRLLLAGERPLYAAFLVLLGASLAPPARAWLGFVPLLVALRIAAQWASVRYGRAALRLRDIPPGGGLGTVAQGGAVLALGVSYRLTYGFLSEASGAVLTIVLGSVLLAQLAAPPLLRLAAGAPAGPLTPARALPARCSRSRRSRSRWRRRSPSSASAPSSECSRPWPVPRWATCANWSPRSGPRPRAWWERRRSCAAGSWRRRTAPRRASTTWTP